MVDNVYANDIYIVYYYELTYSGKKLAKTFPVHAHTAQIAEEIFGMWIKQQEQFKGPITSWISAIHKLTYGEGYSTCHKRKFMESTT